MSARRSSLLVYFVLAACNDGPPSPGAQTTGKAGDLGNAPLGRGRPDAALIAACGRGDLTLAGQTSIKRAPYLQQVTDRSAMIVLAARDIGLTVEISLPDETPVASAAAAVDGSARPIDGKQLVARFTDLGPSTIYCYSVRAGDVTLVGRTGFRTAPRRGSNEPFTFAAFGDFGDGGGDQQVVLTQLEDRPYDLALMLGDVAYDSGTRSELERNLFAVYAPILRSIPVWPASGNHEYKTEDAAPFREFFVLPENGGAAGHERWYSFDWGSVHFVALDTERVGREQAAWLDADLARNDLPRTVVFFHRPPYSSGERGSDLNVRRTFGPIFERHRVDLVLAGHDHNYERTLPQNGVHYVVTGGGGHELRAVGKSEFTAFSDTVLHFVVVSAEPTRLVLHAIDGTGREFDSLAIPTRVAD